LIALAAAIFELAGAALSDDVPGTGG